jgi:uncharacterized membrane protein HdeD (DUF308 family)
MIEELAMTEATGGFWPVDRETFVRDASRWWLFAALGVVCTVVGVVLMIDVVAAETTLALLVALGLVLSGVIELVTATHYNTTLSLASGVALIVAGLIAAFWPDITLWVLAVVVGVGLLVSGAATIVGSLSVRPDGWTWMLFGGVVSFVVGVLALAWPGATLLVLGVILGLRVLIFGLSEIGFGLRLQRLHAELGNP